MEENFRLGDSMLKRKAEKDGCSQGKTRNPREKQILGQKTHSECFPITFQIPNPSIFHTTANAGTRKRIPPNPTRLAIRHKSYRRSQRLQHEHRHGHQGSGVAYQAAIADIVAIIDQFSVEAVEGREGHFC